MFEFVRPAWQDLAECAGSDADLWFPELGGDSVVTVRAAKAVCFTCPVRIDCLEYALANGEKYGVFGGLTPKERRALRRQRKASAA